MVARFALLDGAGSGRFARVTKRNALVTSPESFDSVYNATASVINTAYNLLVPRQAKQFLITSILLYANKDVGASDASVVVYEADSPSSTTSTNDILNIEMLKQTSRDLLGLNLLVSAGKWVNVKTNDNTVFATIMGHYVEEVTE